MENKRKHILALASWYPSRVFLDNGDFIQRHLRAISIQNDVTLIHAIKDNQLKNNFEISDNINQNVREIIIYFKPSFFSPFNLIKQIIAYLKGISLVNDFNIIHLHVVYPAGLIALYLKKRFKKAIVLTEHWSGLHQKNFHKLSFYKKLFIQQILKKVDIICPVSTYLKTEINLLVKNNKYIIIPNVVNLDLFKSLEAKPHQKKRFLHLSNLDDKAKNISAMLRISKKLYDDKYDFEFHIGGNGDSTFISDFITKNKLENCIKIFGRLEHKDVYKKMNDANCFVLFSNYENQPCVQIEAFACGLPIIAKNVGGISEFFPTDFGILVHNEDELYEAMKEVILGKEFENPKNLNEFALQNFSPQYISEKYNQIYNQFSK